MEFSLLKGILSKKLATQLFKQMKDFENENENCDGMVLMTGLISSLALVLVKEGIALEDSFAMLEETLSIFYTGFLEIQNQEKDE